jgi:hypothetical protein
MQEQLPRGTKPNKNNPGQDKIALNLIPAAMLGFANSAQPTFYVLIF